MKVFNQKGITNARGSLLPYDDFELFSDVKSKKLNKNKYQRILERAYSMMDMPIPLLPASVYRQYVTCGNRSNYEDIYFLRRDMAAAFALAEAYENKGRFTEKLMDVVWAIMEESTWLIPAHIYCAPVRGESSLGPVFGNNSLHGIDLFAAATAGTLSSVYLLCKEKLDEIDPIICQKIEYMLKERAIKNYLQLELWWGGSMGNRINNWCPWIVSNILLSTAIIEKDNYIREKVVTKSLRYLDNFLNCYDPDGGCDEGPAYWGAAGASLFDCLELIEDLSGGKITVYDSELVKNIGDYIYKVNISGTRYVNFADCAPRTSPNPGMLVRFGEKTNSPFLVSFGKAQAKYGDYFFSQSHMYRSLKWAYTPCVEKEDCPMPLWSTLPDLGVMSTREYPESEKGFFLAAKGGNNGEMHNHNDCGNFMVYYNGKPVIIDTGVGRYTKQTFSCDRYKLWFMQSGYHNLPSFGGIDQRDGGSYKATNVTFCEKKGSISSELKSAYPEEAGIISYVRRVSLLNKEVSINESIKLSEVKEIDFHIMLASEPRIIPGGRIELAEGRTLYYDKSLTASIEEFDPVGMDTESAWGTKSLYRIHFKTVASSCELRFAIK